jgi:hypothetical protein
METGTLNNESDESGQAIDAEVNIDLLVLRAIGRGTDTRARLRRTLNIEYQIIDNVIKRNSSLVMIEDGEPPTFKLAEPIETAAEVEQARYEEFTVRCREQKVEPMPFKDWQVRWGGPADANDTAEIAEIPATEEAIEFCECGKEKGHRGRHRGIANLSEGANLQTEIDEGNLNELPTVVPQMPEPVIPESPEPSYRVLSLNELDAISPQDLIRRFNRLQDGEIDQFFTILNSDMNARDGIYWGVIENRRDYQKFCRLAYSALIELLTPWMTEAQKNAVWTLILYVNDQQRK